MVTKRGQSCMVAPSCASFSDDAVPVEEIEAAKGGGEDDIVAFDTNKTIRSSCNNRSSKGEEVDEEPETSPRTSTSAGGSEPTPQPQEKRRRGETVSALINRGVQWETWLVGLQHRLLLGITASPNDGIAASKSKENAGGEVGGRGRGGAITTASSSTTTTTTTTASSSMRATKGENRSGPVGAGAGAAMNAYGVCSSRRRYMYRLVTEVADFSERASFHPGFLCWAYASRLLAVAGYFLLAVYLNALATMVSTHRNPHAMMLDRFGQPLSTHTLPDLGHDLWAFCLTRLGYHTDYIDQHALPDRMVKFAGKIAFLFILCHPQRLKIVRRVFTIFGTVLFMRAVSVSVTVLPDASPVCRARLKERVAMSDLFPRAFVEAAHFSWSPTSFVTCGDMVFSGHTTCLVMVALTFRKYCRAEHLQTKVIFRGFHLSERLLSGLRRMVYAYVVMGCLVIIGSKLHYTLDVLLALLICTCAFSGYHDWAMHDLLRKKFRFVEWLESEDVRGQDDLAYTLASRR